MNSTIREPANDGGGLDQMIAPIVEAAETLIGTAEPDFRFVPEKLRIGLEAIQFRLRDELGALLETRAAYHDMVACRVVTQEYPWQRGELSRYQHLRLARSQLTAISDSFERHMTKVRQCHTAVVEFLSIDVQQTNVDGSSDQARLSPNKDSRSHATQLDRWFDVSLVLQSSRPAAGKQGASRWPNEPDPSAEHCESTRSELLREIDARIETMDRTVSGFLIRHGAELLDLVQRYNDMIGNFRQLHERGSN